MSSISLPMGKLYKKAEKKAKTFPAGYLGRFCRNFSNNFDSVLGSDFYRKIANDADIHSEDVQKFLLGTSDFSKSMQGNTNHYITQERINNANFKQKLDLIAKNILRRQNPPELVFQDISTFDAENPIVGSPLQEHNVGKNDMASHLIKKAPQPPGIDFIIQNRLNMLRNNRNNNNNDDGMSPPPSPLQFNNFQKPPPSPPPRTPSFNNLI